MADKEESKPAEKPKRVEAPRGAWVVVDDAGQVLVVESSEIKAFRAAQPFRARVVMWPFGVARESALASLPPVVKP
jgi:hypothetical protein